MLNGKRSHSPAPYRNGNGVKMNGTGNVNNSNHQFNPLLQARRRLPIFPAKRKFLEEATKHDTVILLAQTGTGKTTQIPQFIHESRLDRDGVIAVTQGELQLFPWLKE